jgi:hypothetical protein
VDVIFKRVHELILIEIKTVQTFQTDYLKSLKYFSQLASNRMPAGYLVYVGNQKQRIEQFYLTNYKQAHKIIST